MQLLLKIAIVVMVICVVQNGYSYYKIKQNPQEPKKKESRELHMLLLG